MLKVVHQGHIIIGEPVKGQSPAGVVHVDPYPTKHIHLEAHLHITVPCRKPFPILQDAPVVAPQGAAVAFLNLSGQCFCTSCQGKHQPQYLNLKIVAAKVQTLVRQRLMPVFRSSRMIWVPPFPRSSASHFLVFSCSASHAKGNRKIEKSGFEK